MWAVPLSHTQPPQYYAEAAGAAKPTAGPLLGETLFCPTHSRILAEDLVQLLRDANEGRPTSELLESASTSVSTG